MAIIRTNDQAILGSRYQRVTEDQCKRIHFACLEVVERTGVRLYEQDAIDLLKKTGISVSDGNPVKVPSWMVEKALTTVPKRVVMCNRNGDRVMPLEGYRSYYGPGSDCLNVLDHRTGQRREPVLQDLIEIITVADALPNIDF